MIESAAVRRRRIPAFALAVTLLLPVAGGAPARVLADEAPAAKPAAAAKAKPRKPARRKQAAPRSRTGALDLSVPSLPGDPARLLPGPVSAGGGARSPAPGTLTVAERDAETYKTEPLFQAEQKLQILDAEVPVSVKLGKWKTSEESKALGLSATVPLKSTP
ncbi:hypothetical protein [Nevskia sp.]|uniref:hypothetical protein n=1 Tax=Nevskia sp. TaxID=1929292 RepID=UPI003F6FC2AF